MALHRRQIGCHRGGVVQCTCRQLQRGGVTGQPVLSQHLGQHILRGFVFETRQSQQVAQHTQHLPRGAGVAQWARHGVEALQQAFGIHEAARGFGPRRDGQQHVGHVHVGLEGAEAHHHLGALQARHTGCAVERGLVVEQQDSLQATRQHLACVFALGPGQCAHPLGTHGVGGFGEVAHRGTGLLTNPLRHRQQAGRKGVVRCGIAQQHGLALATQQGTGDGIGLHMRRHVPR